ncbi:hypothetical protein WMF16_35620 [Sorangium sp. So ce388]
MFRDGLRRRHDVRPSGGRHDRQRRRHRHHHPCGRRAQGGCRHLQVRRHLHVPRAKDHRGERQGQGGAQRRRQPESAAHPERSGRPVHRDAAVVSGVDVPKTLLLVYLMAGALYGLAGALLAARTGGATNNYGLMYELDAIAACVIGGVSTSGGIGTVGGVLTGVLIFEVLNNGLVVLGVSAYWQQIIKGIIIVAAVSVDIRKYLRKR